jgi:GMP synthase (glutamine-hydrolysing)
MVNAREFIDDAVRDIRSAVGENKVISACSGGVDSMTATYLVHKAVGDKLQFLLMMG